MLCLPVRLAIASISTPPYVTKSGIRMYYLKDAAFPSRIAFFVKLFVMKLCAAIKYARVLVKK